MRQNDIEPVIYYSNPNIYPEAEYLIRKNEITRYAQELGLTILDEDALGTWEQRHACWQHEVAAGREHEPERGSRCMECFRMRLLRTAQKAEELGIRRFTTTLASSRWKSLEQIDAAGEWAAEQVVGVEYWAKNWRKGGLQQRRNELLKQNNFYNQLYCGCEYSMEALAAREQRAKEASENTEHEPRMGAN